MAAIATPVGAIELSAGDVAGRFDTTVTLGTSVRLQDRDADIIGRASGGEANSVNVDDGNLNFDRGDVTSLSARVTHELDLAFRNFGFFGRGTYFYDAAIEEFEPARTEFSEQVKNVAGADFEVLDAFVTGDFEIGAVDGAIPITATVGSQVLNWGESTFIQNGINIINPVDVTKLRVAGSRVREALQPIPAIDVDLGLTNSLSFEAFYQFAFDQTEIEAAGTFFSTNDFLSPGGDQVFLGFGSIPDLGPLPPGTSAPVGPFVPRAADRDPDDQGQYGFALRYFADDLNSTEFGFYYINYHSRLPIVSARTGTLAGLAGGDYASTASYFAEFPDDIDLFGFSFNTSLSDSGLALQGELSLKHDQPLQVDDVELLFAGLSPLGLPFDLNQLGVFGFDEDVAGFRREDVWQGQVTATQLFGPNLGADQITAVVEAGANWIPGLPEKNQLRFDGPGTFTSGNPAFTGLVQPETTMDGFGDELSWGYRVLARADYLGAVGPINLIPQVAFAHDVRGTTPRPIGNFVQGRKAVTMSLGASYLDNLRGEIGYTTFFGGGDFNLLRDRDFFSVAMSYSF